MAMSRAQFPELMGFQEGGDVTNIFDPAPQLDPSVTTFLNQDFSQTTPNFNFGAPSQASIDAYKNMLRNLSGDTREPDFFDFASIVGQAMLQADPTMGAFRSLGLGLGMASEQRRKTKEARKNFDRQIALKAFELAKTDQDAATKLLNERDLTIAKQKPTSYKSYRVSNPNGIIIRGEKHPQGDEVFLNNSELQLHLSDVSEIKENEQNVVIEDTGKAVYMTEEEGKRFIRGIAPNFEQTYPQDFAKIIDQITVPETIKNDKGETIKNPLLGRDIIIDNQRGTIVPIYNPSNTIFKFTIKPSADYDDPRWLSYTEKAMPNAVKDAEEKNNKYNNIKTDLELILNKLISSEILEERTGIVQADLERLKAKAKDILGLPYEKDYGDIELLRSMSLKLAPMQRQPGSGSTSDMEFAAMLDGGINPQKTRENNYLTAYLLLHKLKQDAILANKTLDLLTDINVSSRSQLNEELNELDKSAFRHYTGDVNDEEEIRKFWDSVKIGEIIKQDPNNPAFIRAGEENAEPYIIKFEENFEDN